MLHPAQKIASFFVAKKLIPAQDYEWAVYGLQRRLLAAVFYPILFLIGLLVKEQSGPAIMTRANGQLILVPAIL